MAKVYMKPPPGSKRNEGVFVRGTDLVEGLKAEGWTEQPAPPKQPRSKERRYYTDHAFRNGY